MPFHIAQMLFLIARTFFDILILITTYILLSFALSLIPENKDFQEPFDSNYEIWIKSNGVHLDIVLPINKTYFIRNDVLIVPDNIKGKVKYAGFGWGDKDFYINTPEWSDLKFSTGFNALFVRTDAAMHVTYYKNLSENEKSISVFVNEQQFNALQSFIFKSFKIKGNKIMPIDDIEYGTYDRFYEANYAYSLFYTCNTWTNEALKNAGLRVCVWTPFEQGVLFQYRNFNLK